MKKTFTVLGLGALLFLSCNSHKKDANTDSNTKGIDTVKTDSGITVVKNKEGKIIQSYPTATGPAKSGTTANPTTGVIGTNGDNVEYPYLITGKLIHGEGGNITLDKLGIGTGEIKPLFVQTVNSEAKFGFNGTCTMPQLMQLRLPAGNIQFIVKPNDNLDFTMTLEDPGDYEIKGSPESMELKSMFQILAKANDEKDVVESRINAAKKDLHLYSHLVDLRTQEYRDIDKVKHANLRKFIVKNDTAFVCMLAALYLDAAEDIDFIRALDRKMVLRYPSSPFYQALHEKVTIYGPMAVGMLAPEIISQTPDGKTVKLSSFRGKYLLLNFWSSISPIARAETPNIKKDYEKYKSKGFEVLSYSIDKDKTLWTKAIEQDKMTWTNISDLLGYQSAGAATYVVTDIPVNYLIDRNGYILARNLKGASLDKKLAELMK